MTTRKQSQKKRSKRKIHSPLCTIPIQVPVLNSSSSQKVGHNFYDWVNGDWLDTVKIPAEETDFGVSEELEVCIQQKTAEILIHLKHKPNPSPSEAMFQTLAHSCLDSASQHHNLDTLKDLLAEIDLLKLLKKLLGK